MIENRESLDGGAARPFAGQTCNFTSQFAGSGDGEGGSLRAPWRLHRSSDTWDRRAILVNLVGKIFRWASEIPGAQKTPEPAEQANAIHAMPFGFGHQAFISRRPRVTLRPRPHGDERISPGVCHKGGAHRIQ